MAYHMIELNIMMQKKTSFILKWSNIGTHPLLIGQIVSLLWRRTTSLFTVPIFSNFVFGKYVFPHRM